jgi:LmbE family N-acetylglucosaminyl deacetylase
MRDQDKPVVLAAVAHPDDIEFNLAGTLLLLKEDGCEVHMWNLSNGSLGSMIHNPEEIAAIRAGEAAAAAALGGATWHPPVFSDLEVFYDKPSLARVASVIREIQPEIILTHSPDDYMEDHQNVCRLIVTAAFARSMPHFATTPHQAPYQKPVRIYHAPPHGLHDGLRNRFQPDLLVDIASVLSTKEEMLAAHRSQKDWLEASQGLGAYISEMTGLGRLQAQQGEGLEFAEGWRLHSHLGFCAPDFDPLADLLAPFVQSLNHNTTHA